MMATKTSRRHRHTLEECVALCLDCHENSLQMVGYLLQKGDGSATPRRIRLLMDCAEICQTAANFMIRGSPLHGMTCFVCAEVCEAAADECQKFADDPTEAECMDACRRCAEFCRQMATESGVSVEYADGQRGGLDYGEALDQVAEAAEEEARTSGARTRGRSYN